MYNYSICIWLNNIQNRIISSSIVNTINDKVKEAFIQSKEWCWMVKHAAFGILLPLRWTFWSKRFLFAQYDVCASQPVPQQLGSTKDPEENKIDGFTSHTTNGLPCKHTKDWFYTNVTFIILFIIYLSSPVIIQVTTRMP